MVLQPLQFLFDSIAATDVVGWRIDKADGFSVANCHQLINSQSIPFGPHDRFNKAYKLVWCSGVPIKISIFGWRCFTNVLPTCDILASEVSYSLLLPSAIFVTGRGKLPCILSCCAI